MSATQARGPMVTDDDLSIIDEARIKAGLPLFSREDMRDLYERAIANGQLIRAKDTIVPHPHSCSSCLERIATQEVGRKLRWPNFCPNCGKRKQDVGGRCSRPVYA